MLILVAAGLVPLLLAMCLVVDYTVYKVEGMRLVHACKLAQISANRAAGGGPIDPSDPDDPWIVTARRILLGNGVTEEELASASIDVRDDGTVEMRIPRKVGLIYQRLWPQCGLSQASLSSPSRSGGRSSGASSSGHVVEDPGAGNAVTSGNGTGHLSRTGGDTGANGVRGGYEAMGAGGNANSSGSEHGVRSLGGGRSIGRAGYDSGHWLTDWDFFDEDFGDGAGWDGVSTGSSSRSGQGASAGGDTGAGRVFRPNGPNIAVEGRSPSWW